MGSTWTLQPTPTLCISLPRSSPGEAPDCNPTVAPNEETEARSEAGQTGSSPVSLWVASSWRH